MMSDTCRCLPLDMSEAEVNELFASCMPRLKKSARKMLRNREDCEDVLQDAMLLAFRKLHQFEGRSSFATWLHSIIRNTSRGQYRKSIAHQLVPLDRGESYDSTSEVCEFIEPGPSPEDICIQKERSEMLRSVAEQMPAKYQSAIVHFHLEGLGEQETARRLHMTSGALKSQLHRSRRLLIFRVRRAHLARKLRSSQRCAHACAESSPSAWSQPFL